MPTRPDLIGNALARRHGHAAGVRSPEYRSWRAMRSRCTNTNNPAYPRYGGRGVMVCSRWDDFENFLSDMGPRPAGLTIERVNNSGHYEPGNCVWATARAQGANKRTNFNIVIRGETKHLHDWCREYGLDPGTVRYRMRKFGWTAEQAVTTPKMRERSSVFEQGG